MRADDPFIKVMRGIAWLQVAVSSAALAIYYLT